VEERLRAQWLAAVRDGHDPTAPVPRPTRVDDELDRLLARHREPHRRYHTATHVSEALATAEELLAAVEGPDPSAVRLALFFHDAIYDARAGGGANEAASAALAERTLPALGLSPACVEAVGAAILATAEHRLPVGGGATTAVVLDADLAILGAEPARYQAYLNGVRAEYAHVEQEMWRIGRAAVLEAFLGRTAIYLTPPMRAHEGRARANLAAELAGLRGGS